MLEPLLPNAQILDALRRLVDSLKQSGVPARIYDIGGAALTLQYGAREATQDVDASAERKSSRHAAHQHHRAALGILKITRE